MVHDFTIMIEGTFTKRKEIILFGVFNIDLNKLNQAWEI